VDSEFKFSGTRAIRAEDLNAIQLTGYQPDFHLRGQPAIAPADARTLFQLDEVGRAFFEETAPKARAGPTDDGTGKAEPWLAQTQVLTALHGGDINFLFGLGGHEFDTHVLVGTWSGAADPQRPGILLRAYMSQFAPVRATRIADALGASLCDRFGLALGFPAPLDSPAGNAADLLLRAMSGYTWGVRVLAAPLDESFIVSRRARLLDDMRRVDAASIAAGVSNRLAQMYLTNVDKHLTSLTQGLSLGLWRVATYLMGTDASFSQLSAMWRGLFSGPHTDHSPVRVLHSNFLRAWIANWVVPDEQQDNLLHPFAYQTVLNSAQLAALTNLPTRETAGFSRKRVARFDVSPSQRQNLVEKNGLQLGAVEDGGLEHGTYHLHTAAFTRHAFVTGVTGSGKTNTLFQLLHHFERQGVPFLILEPAKNEYRALAADPSFKQPVRVITVGDERVAPLRLNPFEVVGWPAIPVSVHIDLLRSCFAASFGMWTPLPQILEQCLHAIYQDRGWDIIGNTNARLPAGADPTAAFPTVADLAAKIEVYTASLGYDEHVRGDLRAALLTRVRGLRTGGKGAMFDTRRSTAMEELLGRHTVLELQNLGDDDDKAFFMAVLFARLVEYRRAMGPRPGALAHVLVIEEAHRLLANVSRAGSAQPEQADPKGKAVESFSNLIAEIRAYGQGLIIVDQVPTKLAPDVVKNTNLKVIHRIVAEDDRAVIAGATAMNPEQKASLAVLGIGKAAVFEDGEDGPLLVSIPRVKDLPGQIPLTDAQLRSGRSPIPPTYETCVGRCTAGRAECNQAREISEDALLQRTFGKLVVSLFTAPGALDRLRHDVDTVANMRPAGRGADRNCLIAHLCHSLAQRWGSRLDWSFPATKTFATTLRQVLDGGGAPALQQMWTECGPMLTQGHAPCIACGVSADRFGDSSPCSVRVAVEDLVDSGEFDSHFHQAVRADEWPGEQRSGNRYAVCNDAAFELIEFPSSDHAEAEREQIAARARRCVLCFAEHMLERHNKRAPWVIRAQLLDIVGGFSHG
jgi:hypothetical protein